ncbi:hypothetical protein [Halorussus ruber]|uniref:hypothetical protein n=1 Tax=Halorussus ruber TaxID=1126238 RepID=UPI0010927844|nr:hypothetical protein [Halorussus ruber]
MEVAVLLGFVRHEHLVVTVEAGRKERIDANLDAGESLEAWVADAIEEKLAREAGDDSDGPGPGDSEFAGSGPGDSDSLGSAPDDSEYADIIELGETDADGSKSGDSGDSDRSTIESGEKPDADDGYDEGFEYVDDCAI